MTKFSRDEIKKMLNNCLSINTTWYFDIIYQLLEENRILREGLEKYGDIGNWGFENGFRFDDEECILFDEKLAQKTLTKADEVGKEEE